MTPPVLRARYLSDSVTTASPAGLLVLLYDRLCLDLERGLAALSRGDREKASAALVHAQDILMELRATLRTDGWAGAAGLADLYAFALGELAAANVEQAPARVRSVLALVNPLREAWREAALTGSPEHG